MRAAESAEGNVNKFFIDLTAEGNVSQLDASFRAVGAPTVGGRFTYFPNDQAFAAVFNGESAQARTAKALSDKGLDILKFDFGVEPVVTAVDEEIPVVRQSAESRLEPIDPRSKFTVPPLSTEPYGSTPQVPKPTVINPQQQQAPTTSIKPVSPKVELPSSTAPTTPVVNQTDNLNELRQQLDGFTSQRESLSTRQAALTNEINTLNQQVTELRQLGIGSDDFNKELQDLNKQKSTVLAEVQQNVQTPKTSNQVGNQIIVHKLAPRYIDPFQKEDGTWSHRGYSENTSSLPSSTIKSISEAQYGLKALTKSPSSLFVAGVEINIDGKIYSTLTVSTPVRDNVGRTGAAYTHYITEGKGHIDHLLQLWREEGSRLPTPADLHNEPINYTIKSAPTNKLPGIRQRKSGGLAGAGLGTAHDVTAFQHGRNGFGLDGCGFAVAFVGDGAL